MVYILYVIKGELFSCIPMNTALDTLKLFHYIVPKQEASSTYSKQFANGKSELAFRLAMKEIFLLCHSENCYLEWGSGLFHAQTNTHPIFSKGQCISEINNT